jgi:hypothetical protein
VRAFVESLSTVGRARFETAFRDSLPGFPFHGVRIEIPKFDQKSAASFRGKVLDLAHALSEREWLTVRGDVYHELNKSLFAPGNERATLALIARLIGDKGTADYAKLLPGLLLHMKGAAQQMAEEIFVTVLNQQKPKDVLAAVEAHARSSTVGIQIAAIEVLTRMLSAIGPDKLSPLLPSLCPTLDTAFQSEAPEVRKAVVLCFVELKVLLQGELDPYLVRLKKSQQKLISVYYMRRTSG